MSGFQPYLAHDLAFDLDAFDFVDLDYISFYILIILVQFCSVVLISRGPFHLPCFSPRCTFLGGGLQIGISPRNILCLGR